MALNPENLHGLETEPGGDGEPHSTNQPERSLSRWPGSPKSGAVTLQSHSSGLTSHPAPQRFLPPIWSCGPPQREVAAGLSLGRRLSVLPVCHHRPPVALGALGLAHLDSNAGSPLSRNSVGQSFLIWKMDILVTDSSQDGCEEEEV